MVLFETACKTFTCVLFTRIESVKVFSAVTPSSLNSFMVMGYKLAQVASFQANKPLIGNTIGWLASRPELVRITGVYAGDCIVISLERQLVMFKLIFTAFLAYLVVFSSSQMVIGVNNDGVLFMSILVSFALTNTWLPEYTVGEPRAGSVAQRVKEPHGQV